MRGLHDFEERHLRRDRSGRQSPGIVSKAPAALAAGLGKAKKGCGMLPPSKDEYFPM